MRSENAPGGANPRGREQETGHGPSLLINSVVTLRQGPSQENRAGISTPPLAH